MKRNTLMKRMAIAALVATMSVGMAVPAMAAPQIVAEEEKDSEKDGAEKTIGNATISEKNQNHTYTVIQRSTFDENTEIKLDKLTGDKDKHASGTIIAGGVENTTSTKSGVSYDDKSTVENGGAPYIRYSNIEYVGDDKNADVTLNQADSKIVITPQKFGTTRFKFTETLYWWDTANVPKKNSQFNRYLSIVKANPDNYKAGKGKEAYSASVTYYIAYDTPVNETTLNEIVEDVSGNVTAASNKTEAAKNVQKAIEAALEKRDPKQTTFVYDENHKITEMSDLNEDLDLDVFVSNPDDLDDDSVKADVTIYKDDTHNAYFLNANYTFKFDQGVPYTDVAEGSYYYDYVKQALKDGAFSADSDTTFGINDKVTRLQFVYAMWKKAGAPQGSYDNMFTDLQGLTADEKTAVSWAVANHYAYGKSNTEFAPNENLNRAAVVQFLWYQEGQPKGYDDVNYTDVDDDAWYKDAVEWGKATGKVYGTTSTTFTPGREVLKKEAASFLYR